MPIVDIELVNGERAIRDTTLARKLADALGIVFNTPEGRTWIRLRSLPAHAFAENDIAEPPGSEAVFVTILAADVASVRSLASVITTTVAAVVNRDPSRVHVLFEASACGRLSFGGKMVERSRDHRAPSTTTMSTTSLAGTPEPPYFAVIFSSLRTEGDRGYDTMARRMVELASAQPGFLGIESARGADGLGITVSYWSSEDAITAWKANAEHRIAQEGGKRSWYAGYKVRIARVERAYGKSPGN